MQRIKREDIFENLFFKCKKLIAYGKALVSKKILDLLNKENLLYYQKIEDFYFYIFKNEIW